MLYQLGWATLPGLRGLNVSEFRVTPTANPDNERGVAVEFASERERDEFLRQIARLPRNQLWRYGQAGDLPERREDVLRLAKANGRRPVEGVMSTTVTNLSIDFRQTAALSSNLTSANALILDR